MATADVKIIDNASATTNAAKTPLDLKSPSNPKMPSTRNYDPVSIKPAGINTVKKDIAWDFWSTIVRRLFGTYTGQLAGRSIDEAYKYYEKKQEGTSEGKKPEPEYVFKGWIHNLLRNVGNAMDASTQFFSGQGQHENEITEIGKKHLNAIQRLRHKITEEEIKEKGWFRPRFYGLTAEELAKMQELEEAAYGSGKKVPEKADELNAYYNSLSPKHYTYGRRNVEVSHDFAIMGETDFIVNHLLKKGKEGLDILAKMADPTWRKSKEFDDFKNNFSLGGTVKGVVAPILENIFRGDGYYDYMIGFFPFPGVMTSLGIDYVTVKENYQRKGSTTKDSPLTRAEKLFNVPFVVYNMLGPIIREMLWDPFFRKDTSDLRKHLKHHAPPEGTGFFRRLFNNVFQIGNYMAMRTYQICMQMFPAVMIFFSPLRHYGLQTKNDLFNGRQDALAEHLAATLGTDKDIIKNAKHFGESIDLKGKHEGIVEAVKSAGKSEADVEKAKKQFFVEYMKGERSVGFNIEDNTRVNGRDGEEVKFDRKIAGVEVGGIEKSITQFKDLIGNKGVKPFTKQFAATFQKIFINQMEANGKLEKTPSDELERMVILTERWAAAYLPYMIYFQAKRIFGHISKADKLINLPTVIYQEMTETLQAVISGNTPGSKTDAKAMSETIVNDLLRQTLPSVEVDKLAADQSRETAQARNNSPADRTIRQSVPNGSPNLATAGVFG